MKRTSQANCGSRVRTALGVTGLFVLGACASTPPAPLANVQAAQQAIATAERGEAARYAPGELGEAHAKLTLADSAITERKMVIAEHFADQSRAEAELASAKASAVKAGAVNEEMKRSNGTLVDEMKRGSGDKQ
ncbi:MAG: DUF4398 domain-containing protein [Steroidobacteraceae bacterium]